MAQSFDVQSIQSQLGDVDKMLVRVMAHLARTNDGQTSQILRDLTQISSTINTFKQRCYGVSGYAAKAGRGAGWRGKCDQLLAGFEAGA